MYNLSCTCMPPTSANDIPYVPIVSPDYPPVPFTLVFLHYGNQNVESCVQSPPKSHPNLLCLKVSSLGIHCNTWCATIASLCLKALM